MPSNVRIVVLAGSAAMLAACTSVQVRSLATNTGQPAFDLSGSQPGALADEAARLCPKGYTVARQWQRSNRPTEGSAAAPNWVLATGVLSYDLQPDSAQMSIACTAP